MEVLSALYEIQLYLELQVLLCIILVMPAVGNINIHVNIPCCALEARY